MGTDSIFGFRHGESCKKKPLLVGDRVTHPKKKSIGTIVVSGRSMRARDVDIYWPGEGLQCSPTDKFLDKLTFHYRCGLSVDRFAFRYLLYLLEAGDQDDSVLKQVRAAIKINSGQAHGTVINLLEIEKILYKK